MKRIKKKKCKVYELIKKDDEYQKKLKKYSYNLYDRKEKILERVDFEYFDYKYIKTRSPRKGVWQIKRYFKKPLTRKRTYVYEDDKLVAAYMYKPIKCLVQKKLYEYDGNGRLYYSKYFEINGELLWESFYKYDKKGRNSEWICNHYSLDDKTTWHYHYDKKGRKSITEYDSTLTGYGLYKYKYDENDNIIEEAYYKKPNKLDHIAVYTYNEKGKKIKFEIVSGDGTNGGFVLYERDAKGNLIRSKSYNQRLIDVSESKYNKYGHVISSIYTNYYCDCRGVRVVPYQMDVLEYEYY
ncbi:hypothetical protein ES705_29270 [subsurface metagenome]